MDNLANADDLAALGLGDLGTPAPAEVVQTAEPVDTDSNEAQSESGTEAGASETVVVGTKTVREQVKIGEVQIEEGIALTPLTRVSGGSKYKFNELRAPVKADDGSFSYASMLVKPEEGEDDAKLRRSVQSATTQENKKHKGSKGGFDGADVYFITRSVADRAGNFVGMRVFRVDGTVAKEG